MRKVNVLPNIVTAFGLACGLFVIFKVNMAGFSTYEMLNYMTWILLLAALADVFDGAIARAIKAESEFGLVFDSLADAISFGVAPSVLLLKSLALNGRTPIAFFALAGAMLYSVCGVLRLVRYNVKAHQAKESKDLDSGKKPFIGVPITASAMVALSVILMVNWPPFIDICPLTQNVKAIILSSIMVIVSYLMVSRIRFPGLKQLHFRLGSFHVVFFAIIISMLVIYGLLFYLPLLLFVIFWGYLLISLFLAFMRLLMGKKPSDMVKKRVKEDDDIL